MIASLGVIGSSGVIGSLGRLYTCRIDQGWVSDNIFNIHLVLVTIAKVIADYDYIFIILQLSNFSYNTK